MKASALLDCLRIVLVRPSHPGNIGAAARAMKTMGVRDLALVAPRHFPDPDAKAMAAGAADVLAEAKVFEAVASALSDCVLAVGFSARRRDLSQPASTLRECVPVLVEALASGKVALVFGNETSGLSNAELAHCQRLVAIAADPDYGSLNLAQSVQVACYELACALRAFEAPMPRARTPATVADLEGLFAEFERLALESRYLDAARPGRFRERIRRLFARAGLEREEVRLLRGLLGRLQRRAEVSAKPVRRPAAAGAPGAGARKAPSRTRARPRSRTRS